jgi:arsenate reductase-like glutaredoxin family protein
MSDIKVTSREVVYILQALNHTVLDIAYAYKDLDLDKCSEEELQDFANEQVFLKDLLETRSSLIEKYKILQKDQPEMVEPELLDLPSEAQSLLNKFFPKK